MTIADDLRRDPADLPRVLRGARSPAAAVRVADPAEHDPSALFTIAGMHPLKPYFPGAERPPHPRVTTCQTTFRTVDIEIIGTTTRHLTFFEMLGNFSFGDYFKREAARFAWDLSPEGFGFPRRRHLDHRVRRRRRARPRPDQEAIEAWLEVGVPRERIVECPRSENFWQAGPDRAVRPVLGAVPRPRRRARQARRPSRRRQRALPRVLEPRVHAVRPEPGERADAAAGQEHRHRPRAEPHGGDRSRTRRRCSRPTSSRR